MQIAIKKEKFANTFSKYDEGVSHEAFSTIEEYRISSNKCRVSNKRRLLISATPLGIHNEISASL